MTRITSLMKLAQEAYPYSIGQQPQGEQPPQDLDRMKTHAFYNDMAERYGGVTSMALPTMAGAALGSRRVASRLGMKAPIIKNKKIGALAGLTTAMTGNLIGRLTGRATDARTRAGQMEYDAGHHALANLFIPGAAAYNGIKRKERMQLAQWHG